MNFSASMLLVCFLITPSSHAAVSGTVRDTANQSVFHALVTFTNESDSTQFRAVTDSLGQFQIVVTPTAVEDKPALFSLGQNYPNPFNPSTTIPFSLDAPGQVTLTIFNIMGQRVRTLLNDYRTTGQYSVVWNGTDDSGIGVATGIYFYQLRNGNSVQTKKMLLLDGGGTPAYSSYEGVAKQAAATNLYTITVERFGFKTYRQQHVDTNIAHDFVLQDSGELVNIPGGTFQMGDVECIGDTVAVPVHTVTLTEFDMSMYEITSAQYILYLNSAIKTGDIEIRTDGYLYGKLENKKYLLLKFIENKSFITYYETGFSVPQDYARKPVVLVTWYGSNAFAKYYGLDLPTEAEWEYACRGGRQYEYGTDDGTISSTKANYWKNGPNYPINVGSYPANHYGLYDMSGNVWEWCHDWFGKYTSASVTNPAGENIGTERIMRGGSWSDGYDGCFCRSSYRDHDWPVLLGESIGFRVVRRPGGLTY